MPGSMPSANAMDSRSILFYGSRGGTPSPEYDNDIHEYGIIEFIAQIMTSWEDGVA